MIEVLCLSYKGLEEKFYEFTLYTPTHRWNLARTNQRGLQTQPPVEFTPNIEMTVRNGGDQSASTSDSTSRLNTHASHTNLMIKLKLLNSKIYNLHSLLNSKCTYYGFEGNLKVKLHKRENTREIGNSIEIGIEIGI